MLNENSNEAARKLDKLSRELRALRQKASERDDLDRFSYASAVVESSVQSRDAFFEALETLVDRHTAKLVRIKTIQIFIEFGAIEGAMQGEQPVGLAALASLGNIMRSSRQIDRLFVEECLTEPLTPVILGMSEGYLAAAVTEIASWVKSTNYPDEFAKGLSQVAKKIAKLHQQSLLKAQGLWEKPASETNEDWRTNQDNNAFNDCSEIIHFSCRNSDTARQYLPELPMILYTKLDVFLGLKAQTLHSKTVFSPFKLISAIATACPDAALFFAGPDWNKNVVGDANYRLYNQLKAALKRNNMVKLFLEKLAQLLWDERDKGAGGEKVADEAGPSVLADQLTALFAICGHSSAARQALADNYKKFEERIARSMQNNGPLAPFSIQIIRRAREYAQTCPALTAACLRGYLLLIKLNNSGELIETDQELVSIRNDIEHESEHTKFEEFVRLMQDVCKQLLTSTIRTNDTKLALINAIEIMTR